MHRKAEASSIVGMFKDVSLFVYETGNMSSPQVIFYWSSYTFLFKQFHREFYLSSGGSNSLSQSCYSRDLLLSLSPSIWLVESQIKYFLHTSFITVNKVFCMFIRIVCLLQSLFKALLVSFS